MSSREVRSECSVVEEVRGPVLRPSDSSSLLHIGYSPLRSSQMLIDTALERAEAELSNAISTTA